MLSGRSQTQKDKQYIEVVAHTFHPSTWEKEAGVSLN